MFYDKHNYTSICQGNQMLHCWYGKSHSSLVLLCNLSCLLGTYNCHLSSSHHHLYQRCWYLTPDRESLSRALRVHHSDMLCQASLHFAWWNWGFLVQQSHTSKVIQEATLRSCAIILVKGPHCFPDQWQSKLKVIVSPADSTLSISFTNHSNHFWCFIFISTGKNYPRLCFVMIMAYFIFYIYIYFVWYVCVCLCICMCVCVWNK